MRSSAFFALFFVVAPALSWAQAPGDPNMPPPPPDQANPSENVPPPAEPPPSQAPPPMPQPPGAAPAPASSPTGQWVNTNQYGWVYMPYDRQYTYIPGDAQTYPEEYVYYPVYGWRWVVAPWVYGYGPQPYWGGPGLRFFAWYAHPWFRVGGHWGWGGYHGWGHYRGWVGPRAWGGRGWAGAPGYYRSGMGGRPHPLYHEGVRRAVEHERHEHR